MAISKIVYKSSDEAEGEVWMDVTGDNPATDNMLVGTRATGANGETVQGAVVTAPASTSNPEMDGTAAPGTASTYSRGDHVHPTDTSRAPTSHASSATTYGTGSSSYYGHLKLSDSTSSTSGTSGGIAATPSAVKAVMDAIPSVPSAYTSNPAMDGTASAGSSTSWAKGDHVHPTDTSRAPTSHSSSSNVYGLGTSGAYGHLKLSDSTTSTSSTNGGVAATPAAVKAVADAIPTVPSASTTTPSMDGTASYGSGTTWARADHVHPTDTSRAPTDHASSAQTYGKGSNVNYGHVKLTDATDSTSGSDGGVAATPAAVKAAYDLANGKQSPATTLAGYGITDAATSAELSTFVRPNILDNWYFIGGGSQQGGGQFPVNQRGATSYSGGVYGVDRWKAVMSNSTVSIQSAGLRITATASLASGNRLLYQVLESPGTIAGKTLTFSFYVSEYSGSSIRASIRYVLSGTTTHNTVIITGTGLYKVTATIPSGVTDIQVCFLTLNDASMASGSYFTIEAVKLEVGSTQTLAHYDSANSVWVLNEVPNYQQELAKCQRYFIKLGYRSDSTYVSPIGAGYASSATSFRLMIPLPVTMRASPSIEYLGTTNVSTFRAVQGGNAISLTSISFVYHNDGVLAVCTVETGLTTNDIYLLQFNNSVGFYLSADL